MSCLVSLCIPTNGVIEWIFPVLDSIYEQNIDDGLFEVNICDNGNNELFQMKMIEYCSKHDNIHYKRTDKLLFLSEPEAYKMASGKFIKFINHRTKLRFGTLQYFIDYAEKYENEIQPPIIYFSNNTLHMEDSIVRYETFSEFVHGLQIYGTWSTGMAIWKKDFENIPSDEKYNELFPHTNILFRERNRIYIIDDKKLIDEIPSSHTKKGEYDLFYAFGVEWLFILMKLMREDAISMQDFFYLKNETLKFCINLAIDFLIYKYPCSYDVSSFETSMQVFYNLDDVKDKIFMEVTRRVKDKYDKKSVD
ncbi:hypothetical protein [Selenomonas sp. FC4001]|uniref:hypothetical protein n=1 Tax=Selenomonas sp. FC4001 TaxID=1408313 RepID=UPI00055D3DC8|nr:hypothetical protein [Selenomonas sp. FC4001]